MSFSSASGVGGASGASGAGAPVPITIAISKGRIYDEAAALLARAGLAPEEAPGRRLILDTPLPGVRLLIIRAADVPCYVTYGAADLGITGRDVLLEQDEQGFYEPLDLGIARCRMVLAGLADAGPTGNRPRVASKYVHTARNWFARRGQQVDIIRLYGSMELAPLLGLADQIVDLSATGHTLKANGLVPLATLAEISARLIVNKAAMKTRGRHIEPFIQRLADAVDQGGDPG